MFLHGSWELNSGPHACTNPLPPEPPAQPSTEYLKVGFGSAEAPACDLRLRKEAVISFRDCKRAGTLSVLRAHCPSVRTSLFLPTLVLLLGGRVHGAGRAMSALLKERKGSQSLLPLECYNAVIFIRR